MKYYLPMSFELNLFINQPRHILYVYLTTWILQVNTTRVIIGSWVM